MAFGGFSLNTSRFDAILSFLEVCFGEETPISRGCPQDLGSH